MRKKVKFELLNRGVILRPETERALRSALEYLMALTPRMRQLLKDGAIYEEWVVKVDMDVKPADSAADSDIELV